MIVSDSTSEQVAAWCKCQHPNRITQPSLSNRPSRNRVYLGKTDTAVQIMSVLYNNCPGQRTLLITHSNQALNDLFTKVGAKKAKARLGLCGGGGGLCRLTRVCTGGFAAKNEAANNSRPLQSTIKQTHIHLIHTA